jgi:hypothetical protein
MSHKPFLSFNENIVSSGNMTGNITSSSHDVSEVHDISIQAVWDGVAPVGDTAVEYSLDDITYTRDPDSILAVSGATGSNFYNIAHTGFKYIRLVYIFTGGSGTLNVKISGKI